MFGIPEKIGRYRIERLIAEGGMAQVYLATLDSEDGFSHRIVVKRLKTGVGNEAFSKMFSDEARLLTKLRHPNVVGVFELSSDEIGPFLVMEYVDGVDLGRLFYRLKEKGERLPLKYSLYIVARSLEALSYAHLLKGEDGNPLEIVHRDVSPPNILLSYAGAVKLADFGIARGKHRNANTTTGHLKGKYAYMSPEQVRGEELDSRTDVFAMGIILYELLTGERLFDDENDFEVLKRVEACKIPFEKINEFDPELRHILLKALQRDPASRYQDALSFLEDVEEYSRKGGVVVLSHQLGEYLCNIFPKPSPKRSEVIIEKTHVLNKKKRSLGKFALLFAFVAMFAFLSGDSFFIDAKEEPAPVIEKNIEPEVVVAQPKISGRVIIDARPSGANCELTINGKTEARTLPVALNNIDLSSPVKGSFIIAKDGYVAKKGSFELNSAQSSFSRTYQLTPVGKGGLSVNASPWGFVSVPGIAKGAETPFGPMELEEGSYNITVSYPPDNKVLTKTLEIKAGQDLRCMAEFGPNATLSCY